MSEEEKRIVINEINSQIALAVKAMLVTIIPIGISGLVMLVANHYGQQQLKQQVSEMTATMKLTNERVTIMWMLGGYSERYKSQLEKQNED